MNYINIDNINIPDLEIYHKLRDNAFSADNSFIADSPKVVNLLLESDIEVKSILATQDYYEKYKQLIDSKNISKLFLVDKMEMQNIVGHKIHHNCMMHGIRPREYSLSQLDNNIIMLDAITSSENIGSIARSAAALGVNSYLIPKQSPHPYARRALRVSMGYISKLKTHIYEDIFQTIHTLKAHGYKIFAAEVTTNSIALSKVKIPNKWVLIMGHEGKGISQNILKACDEIVSIEMQEGIKSFNVAVAASVMMYQFKIQLTN